MPAPEWTAQSLADLLERLLVAVEAVGVCREVYIVVDRLDCCCRHQGGDVSRAMEVLAGVVTRVTKPGDTSFRVKILVDG